MKTKVCLFFLILGLTIAITPQKSYALGFNDLKNVLGSVLGESTINFFGWADKDNQNSKDSSKGNQLDGKNRVEGRDGDFKTKVCEQRKVMFDRKKDLRPQITKRMITSYEAILKRAQEFYLTKVVPAGGKVSNYDALVADIQTKKTAVDTAISALQIDIPTFDCTKPTTADNGLGSNKALLENVKTAIKNYREAVRTLVKAIREEAKRVLPEKADTKPGDATVKIETKTQQ